MFKSKITNEEIKQLEPIHFEGKIHLIKHNADVPDAVAFLKKQKILGFDTETKPTFKKNQYHKVALLQLSTETDAFLFRLHYLTLFKPVFSILSDPNIVKVGVAIDGDLKDLLKLEKFNASNFIELQSYVKKFNIENIGLRKLGGIVLNGKISKQQQRSNWELNPLKQAQLTYAATDAWASLLIYQKLKSSIK